MRKSTVGSASVLARAGRARTPAIIPPSPKLNASSTTPGPAIQLRWWSSGWVDSAAARTREPATPARKATVRASTFSGTTDLRGCCIISCHPLPTSEVSSAPRFFQAPARASSTPSSRERSRTRGAGARSSVREIQALQLGHRRAGEPVPGRLLVGARRRAPGVFREDVEETVGPDLPDVGTTGAERAPGHQRFHVGAASGGLRPQGGPEMKAGERHPASTGQPSSRLHRSVHRGDPRRHAAQVLVRAGRVPRPRIVEPEHREPCQGEGLRPADHRPVAGLCLPANRRTEHDRKRAHPGAIAGCHHPGKLPEPQAKASCHGPSGRGTFKPEVTPALRSASGRGR